MPSLVKSLRLLAEPTRIRIILLLQQEDLTVAELQEILSMGQSRISSQLSQLKQEGLVEDRRSGKNVFYGLANPATQDESTVRLITLISEAADEIPDVPRDRDALHVTLRKREDKSREFFDRLAGKFGREYVPGRSWKALAETLFKLMPPQIIADLGAGEGTLSLLLAQRARQVIAVDISQNMVDYGKDIATKQNIDNIDFRLGDISEPPIDAEAVDLAIFSQALHHARKPLTAIQAAHRILKPGGRIVILDLLKHSFEEAKNLYADVWLGFAEVELYEFLRQAGFEDADISIVSRESESPHFQTLLAIATKP